MITKPNSDSVIRQLEAFERNRQFQEADRVVKMVFSQWPCNQDIEKVLVKVIVLNRLYSTYVFAVHEVAAHIVKLNIDARLSLGDANLVHEVAEVTINNKPRRLLSFATKYCHWHQPNTFQIYDGNVDEALWRYREAYGFACFKRQELKNYPRFVEIVAQFVDHFDLHKFSRKQIDTFLWMEMKQKN